MIFDIITLAPDMFELYSKTGIIGRAVNNGLIEINAYQLRDYSTNKHKHVDDYPYSGGPGMLIKADVISNAMQAVDAKEDELQKKAVVYMTPKGRKFDQRVAKELSEYDKLIVLVGAFEGIDQRAIDKYVDLEISMGDFVTTSGDLPALTMIDSVVRLLPGVLGSDDSSVDESHSTCFLEYPQYTRPEIFEDMKVPEILLSGNHAKIAAWKELQSIEITEKNRPDMLANIDKNELEQKKRKLRKILNRK